MKPTLLAFLSIFSLAAILSACSPDQGETTGMGETDTEPQTDTTQIEPEMEDDAEQTGQFGGAEDTQQDTQADQETTFGGEQETAEEEVDLPEEAPAAGQESPYAEDTETDTGIGTETQDEADVEMDTEQQSPGTGN